MPGSYPRSTNPYFPFKKMDIIERELARFHNLCASFSFLHWATSTVFSSYSSALQVAFELNRKYPNLGGCFVVATANETLIWCKKLPNDTISSQIVAWSAPVADSGWIIVFVPDNEVLLTASEYQNMFNIPPYLDFLKQVYNDYKNPNDLRPLSDKFANQEINPPDYKPVNPLPLGERCKLCGELIQFCKCPII